MNSFVQSDFCVSIGSHDWIATFQGCDWRYSVSFGFCKSFYSTKNRKVTQVVDWIIISFIIYKFYATP